MTETILKMLEDPESCDDEVNARIYEWATGEDTIAVTSGPHKGNIYCYYPNRTWKDLPKYTTSLDAAMSIGAEELKGWVLTRTAELLDDTSLIFSTALSSGDGEILFANTIEDFANAICHARISALDYVRKGKVDD